VCFLLGLLLLCGGFICHIANVYCNDIFVIIIANNYHHHQQPQKQKQQVNTSKNNVITTTLMTTTTTATHFASTHTLASCLNIALPVCVALLESQ
jgi:preprotein translocase subunit SecF